MVAINFVGRDHDRNAQRCRSHATPPGYARCPSHWSRRMPTAHDSLRAPAAAQPDERRFRARYHAMRSASPAKYLECRKNGIRQSSSTLAAANRLGVVMRRKADAGHQCTRAAPARASATQPLKPLWPVTRTRLPRQNPLRSAPVSARFSMAPCLMPRVLPAWSCRAMYPSRCQKPRCSNAIICPIAASRIDRRTFPTDVIAFDADRGNVGRQNEKTAIDQTAVAAGLFGECRHCCRPDAPARHSGQAAAPP